MATPKDNKQKATKEVEAKAKADAAAKEAEAKAKAEAQEAEVVDGTAIFGHVLETKTKGGLESHWRGGKKHTKEKQQWPAGTFTNEQFAKLKSDAHLVVKVDVEVDKKDS